MGENGKNIFAAMMIDTHVHFWKYDARRDAWITDDMKLLQQDYLPEHLSVTLRRNGVEGVVAVQADQSELETHFLKELADTHPLIRGVVGWTDLLSPDLPQRLHYFSQYPVIKGWRHIVQAEPDEFLLNPAFQAGVRKLAEFNYTYDLLVYHRQLPAALQFLDQVPDQKIVIDHCAKPDIRHKHIADWKRDMQAAARHPNLYCKLSGLFTEAAWKEWSAADFYPYLDVVFEAFGPERLMFGSDWPVMLLSGIYVQWVSLLEKYMEAMDEDDRHRVMGGNAMRFYNL